MKYFFASTLILCFTIARSQSLPTTDSVEIYLSRLGWHSFGVAWKYFPQLSLYEDAKRMIKINDETKIKKLIIGLADSQKTVVIHQILTSILEPGNDSFGVSYIYGKDGRVNGCDFTYNGLQWSTDSLQKGSVSQEEINKVERYWRQKESVRRSP
jgi:hypothetical protein